MQKPSKQVLKKILRFGKIGAYLCVPIFLFSYPADYFDHGQSISLFELIGVDGYYSKGITRGCMHLLHLDFAGAAAYNKLSFVIVPLLIGVWASGLWREIKIVRQAYFSNSLTSSPTSNPSSDHDKSE